MGRRMHDTTHARILLVNRVQAVKAGACSGSSENVEWRHSMGSIREYNPNEISVISAATTSLARGTAWMALRASDRSASTTLRSGRDRNAASTKASTCSSALTDSESTAANRCGSASKRDASTEITRPWTSGSDPFSTKNDDRSDTTSCG